MPYGVYQRQTHTDPPTSKSGLKGVIFYPHLKRKPWKVPST